MLRKIAVIFAITFVLVACVQCMSDATKNTARLIAHDAERTAQQADQ